MGDHSTLGEDLAHAWARFLCRVFRLHGAACRGRVDHQQWRNGVWTGSGRWRR